MTSDNIARRIASQLRVAPNMGIYALAFALDLPVTTVRSYLTTGAVAAELKSTK